MVDKKLLIIDGNALVHRAYHAIPQTLYTKNNELVNAVFGFTSMLVNVLSKLKPDYVVCTFDMPGSTFRHEIYPRYKENRKGMDNDLANQLQKIREIVDVFNIPILERPGVEADDVIGSLSINALKDHPELEVIILTGDRDILQLLNDRVKVILPGKTFADLKIYDESQFIEKFGFESKYLIDYKALYGDKSDDIPGVHGIGEKSAQDLILAWGGIENIYAHLNDIKPSLKVKLEAGSKEAILSKTLATINTNLQVTFDFSKSEIDNFSKDEVKKKFLEFEFKSLLNKIPSIGEEKEIDKKTQKVSIPVGGEGKETNSDTKYTIVKSLVEMQELVNLIRGENVFSLDTETDSLDSLHAKIFGISIGFSGKRAYYIPVKNGLWDFQTFSDGLNRVDYIKEWGNILNILKDQKNTIVMHNSKYDIEVLASCSIKLNGLIFDTMLASYILNLPEIDLKSLAFLYEGVEMVTYSELSNNNKTLINDIDIDSVGMYSCADADITFRLYERFKEMLSLKGNEKLSNLFYNIEMPLVDVLVEMEEVGIKLDSDYLESLGEKVDQYIIDCKKDVFELVGHEFNIGSPKQLAGVIFDELHLPTGRKIKTGYSTDERYFQSIGDIHPVIAPIRKYKEMMKLKSTYILTLPKLIDNKGRIHTSYNQAVASSGRLSSSNPNLQNIPVKTEIGNEIRNAFIVDKNSLFISLDYSQIELRILAHMSKDTRLTSAFIDGIDIHKQTAQLLFSKSDISSEERRVAKTINFSVIYGISSFGLAGQLGITRQEAQDFINKYFQIYTGVKAYIEEQKALIEDKCYVESLLGRKRMFPGIKEAGAIAKSAMLREAVNMPIQGTNADIIKIAMRECFDIIREKGYQAKMLLQVHDELIFEYLCNGGVEIKNALNSHPDIKDFCLEMKGIMEGSFKLDVPILADVAIGKRWGSLVDIDV